LYWAERTHVFSKRKIDDVGIRDEAVMTMGTWSETNREREEGMDLKKA
jgi:hypothetical protein